MLFTGGGGRVALFIDMWHAVWLEKEVLEKQMKELVNDYQDQWDKEKVVLILNEACGDGRAGQLSHREDACGK